MTITKRDLGVGYLVGTGGLLTGVLLVEGIRLLNAASAGLALGLLSGTVPAASLASVHCWLDRVRLDDDQVWTVAMWGGLGIGLLTLVGTGVVMIDRLLRPIPDQGLILLVGNVAVGGVAGVCIGGLWEVNKNARALTEKNTVLNRVMRHNIRHDVQVIQGQVDLIERRFEATPRTEAITDKVDDIVRRSEQARQAQATIEATTRRSTRIDVVRVVEARVAAFRDRFPGAEIDTALPATARVLADEGLGRVIDALVENAIEHADDRPTVRIAVSAAASTEEVEIVVEDDGPGIPDPERDALFDGPETPLQHGNGLDLWLVKWFVESHRGSLTIDSGTSPAGGTTVRITLPRASQSLPGLRLPPP